MATSTSSDIINNVTSLKRAINSSINVRFATLSEALESSLQVFSYHLFEVGLIDRATKTNPNYGQIMNQFRVGMSFKHSITELQEHCQVFTDALEKLNGPLKLAARELSSEWNTKFQQYSHSPAGLYIHQSMSLYYLVQCIVIIFFV